MNGGNSNFGESVNGGNSHFGGYVSGGNSHFGRSVSGGNIDNFDGSLSEGNGDHFDEVEMECPLCGYYYPTSLIERHAAACSL